MAFCPGRLASNPRKVLGFFQFIIAVNLFSLSIGLFQIMCNRTVQTPPPSSFLFPIIIYHCQNYQRYQERGNMKSKKRPGKAHTWKSPPRLFFHWTNMKKEINLLFSTWLSCHNGRQPLQSLHLVWMPIKQTKYLSESVRICCWMVPWMTLEISSVDVSIQGTPPHFWSGFSLF